MKALVRVIWRPLLPLPVEWDEAFLDAVDAARRRRIAVEHETSLATGADLAIVGFPASAMNEDSLRSALVAACASQRTQPPSRMALVACGRADLTVAEEDIDVGLPAVADGADRNLLRALEPSVLRSEAERWIVVTARKNSDANFGVGGGDYIGGEAMIQGSPEQERRSWWSGGS